MENNKLQQHFQRGFSLIELMVVIAIVGLLAAVAVPSYQIYLIQSRASSIVPVMDVLVENSIVYSSVNGYFPNAYQLGLSSTPGATWADNPTALNTYFSAYTGSNIPEEIYITDESVAGATALLNVVPSSAPCGQYGTVSVYVNTFAMGAGINGDYANAECDFWNYQGIIYKSCYYFWTSGGNAISNPGTLIQGWVNLNTTTGWDFNNQALELNQTSFQNATCQ